MINIHVLPTNKLTNIRVLPTYKPYLNVASCLTNILAQDPIQNPTMYLVFMPL